MDLGRSKFSPGRGAPSLIRSGEQRTAGGGRRILGRFTVTAHGIYLAAACAAWWVMRTCGDRWWVATTGLLFGPRWVLLLPLPVLMLASLLWHRRSLVILVASASVTVFAVMGFCVPWSRTTSSGSGRRIRVLTCNIHRHLPDPSALASQIASANPDVVAIQEWSSQYEIALFGTLSGWYVRRDGELFLASRFPITHAGEIIPSDPGSGSAVWYELETEEGAIGFVNLHLASPHRQFEAVVHGEPGAPARVAENSAVRREQSQAIARALGARGLPMLLAGDFNTPVESPVFRDAWGAYGDAFERGGLGVGFTYYANVTAFRIDHLLYDGSWTCSRCFTGTAVGSPHRPVIGDFRYRVERAPPKIPASSL